MNDFFAIECDQETYSCMLELYYIGEITFTSQKHEDIYRVICKDSPKRVKELLTKHGFKQREAR